MATTDWARSSLESAPRAASDGSGVHSRPLRPGDRIDGKYIVRRTVGSGGWAFVYEAEHVVMKHSVAIKVLRPDDESHAIALERFKREARISATIRHRNVLEAYDVGHLDDGAPYLVMELLHGEDLDSRLGHGPLHVAEVLDVADQLLGALCELAVQDVVHRDIKPHNLFLHEQDDGEVVLKLLDFGIARQEDGQQAFVAKLTTAGELLGTPHYMSPEQLRGETLDCRSDLWSTAIVLYELLTATTPFEEPTQNALIASILRDPTPDIHRLRPDCPAELAEVIYRGLEKDRDARWSHPAEMREALVRVRDALGLPAGSDAWSAAARMVSQRPPLPRGRPSSAPTAPFPTGGAPLGDVDGALPAAAGHPMLRPSHRVRSWLAAAVAFVVLPALGWLTNGAESYELSAKPASTVKTQLAQEPPAPGGDEGEGIIDDEQVTLAATASESALTGAAVAAKPAEAERDDGQATDRARRRAAAARTRRDPEALRQRALAAYVRGRLPDARRLYLATVRAAPSDRQAWRGLGMVTMALGRKGEARRAFQRYLRLSPEAADAPQIRQRLQSLDG